MVKSMLNKRDFKSFNKVTVLVFCIMLTIALASRVYARFHNDIEGTIHNKVAFYVIDPEPQTQEIKIGELAPDGQNFTYDIDVSNFKDSKTSEVDMEYTMQIITTTNVPVTYSLYANGGNTNIIGNRETIQDTDGMYFFKYAPQVGNFVHGVAKTDSFRLVINFPESYKLATYQDLIDTIEITIDARQTVNS